MGKTITIEDEIWEKLHIYRIKNKCETLSDAIKLLMKKAKNNKAVVGEAMNETITGKITKNI